MKKRYSKLSARDYEILFFLWRWKLTTTSVIEYRFYPLSKGLAAYYRMWRLERAGFVVSQCTTDRRHTFWTLSTKGFSVIRDELPPLVEEGYKSENMKHDLIVQSVHLGNWLRHEPSNKKLFTEQELRRIDKNSYPEWVPKTLLHRPDGYWHIDDGKPGRLIGLEIELSQKKLDEYRRVADFYRLDTRAEQVIWIVKSEACMRSIQNKINQCLKHNENVHGFILMSDFLKRHWQTTIVIGKNQGKSVEEILLSTTEEDATTPQQGRNELCWKRFFDTRKMPIKTPLERTVENKFFIN